MKSLSFAKNIAIAAVLSGAALAAGATTTPLGAAMIGTPLPFHGVVAPGTFIDTFVFTLPDNGGSGYSVIDFPLSFSGFEFKTVFSAITLYYAGANGVIGGGDDVALQTATSMNGSSISMSHGATASGTYFLDVFGRADGLTGGLYNGAISISAVTTPVPEPESYAMFLAGLGIMGAIAARRNKAKKG